VRSSGLGRTITSKRVADLIAQEQHRLLARLQGLLADAGENEYGTRGKNA
jgi:hypothetical protein